MAHLVKKLHQAKSLRASGFSLGDISDKLKISKSTASLWLQDFPLSSSAQKKLEDRKLLKYSETSRIKREQRESELKKEALGILDSLDIGDDYLKIFCSLLYICEGAKDIRSGISFCNSDPFLIKTFLNFLRASFQLEESKFRVSLHIHDYHNLEKQISFWSGVTNIPKDQFIKPYRKPHTGKRIKDNYQGCINVRYHNSLLARKIYSLGKELLIKYGDVG